MTLEFRRMPKRGRSTQRYSYEVTDAGGKFKWLADGRSLVYIDKFLNGEYCFEVCSLPVLESWRDGSNATSPRSRKRRCRCWRICFRSLP